MNQQLHGEFADPLCDKRIGAKFDPNVLFDVNKRLLRAFGANILGQPESFGMQAYDPAVPLEGGNSQRRPASVLNFYGTTRHKNPALVLAGMLGIAVSFWGLYSKLSLYHPGMAQRAVPTANFLSQKERPASCLKPVSVWGAVKSLPDLRHVTLSHANTARRCAVHLQVEDGPQELPAALTFQAQPSWRISSGISRAPPEIV